MVCEDIGPIKSKVNVTVHYLSSDDIEKTRELELNLIYEVNGEMMNRLSENGKWSIYNIAGIGWNLN